MPAPHALDLAKSEPDPRKSQRFISVGTKLAVAMLVVLAVVTSVAYIQVRQNERSQRRAAQEKAASMVGQLFSAGVAAPLAFGDEPSVRDHVATLRDNRDIVYAAVFAADPQDPAHLGEELGEGVHRDRSVAAPARPVSEVTLTHSTGLLTIDHPVRGSAGELLGVVRLGFSTRGDEAAVAEAENRILFTSLTLAIGLLLVLLALTRTIIVRRLDRLARAAKQFEAHGGEVVFELEANDEVGGLALALTSMGRTIASREAHISARNADLRRVLDNVAEGLVTVTLEGAMSDERSHVLDEWFGAPTTGQTFFDWFCRFAPETAQWLRLSFASLAEDIMPVEVVIDQIPKRFEFQDKCFEIDVRPIFDGERLDQTLVVVRDITTRLAGERAELAQRETINVFRRILHDRFGFEEFFREASRLVGAITEAEVSAAVEGELPLELERESRLTRDLHTLKGNTAIFGVESVREVCQSIEERLQEEGGVPTLSEKAQLRTVWKQFETLTSDLRRPSTSSGVELSHHEYGEHLMQLHRRLGSGNELVEQVRTWTGELAERRLERLVEQVYAVARRVGKPDPYVETTTSPRTMRLPVARWQPFWTVFAHVLRNMMDHGVESPAERESLGKDPRGKLDIRIHAHGSGVDVRISDDGRGIAWAAIRKRAQSLGMPHSSRADLEEALFQDRVSSKQSMSETSGRGVGMGAVRDVVHALGGEIRIETEPGRGTAFIFRFPIVMMDSDGDAWAARLASKVA